MTTLTTIQTMTEQDALIVLSDEAKTKEIVETIKSLATSEVLDVNKPSDRKRMRSLASSVSKSKSLIDGHGKKLVEPIKAQAKAIDANRKIVRDSLDAIRDEVKQPAVDFDNMERERVENHNAAIQYINSLADVRDEFGADYDSGQLKASLEEAEEIIVSVEHCEEFATDYAKAKATAISNLKVAIQTAEKREDEAKELEELRQLKSQKEKEEYEAKLKAEAAEKAEREAAEAKIQAELAEQRRIEAEKQAEIDKIKAQEQAKIQAERAAEEARLAEVERQKQAEAQAKAEREKREANKRHCTKINTEAKNAIVTLGVEDALAKRIVAAIAKGMIPNVTINY